LTQKKQYTLYSGANITGCAVTLPCFLRTMV